MSPRTTRKRARTSQLDQPLSDTDTKDTVGLKTPEDAQQITQEDAHMDVGEGAQAHGVENENNNGSPPLKKDEEFWLEDGTAILIARDVEFRVYGGLLAKISSVMKDLVFQPADVRSLPLFGDQYFQCPVVHLSDSPEDLRHLLRAYMPPLSINLYKQETPSFHVISAHLRLGHKYQITPMYEQALAFLRAHFTSDLETWCSNEFWMPRKWLDKQAIGVPNLVRLTGELSLLPTACMACMQLARDIVAGYTREDGSQEHLTLEDVATCMLGGVRLHKAGVAHILRIISPPASPECKTKGCRSAMRDALERLKNMGDDLVTWNVFASYTEALKGGTLSVCSVCREMVDERERRERRALWARLPELLGIDVPGWPQLVQLPLPANLAS